MATQFVEDVGVHGFRQLDLQFDVKGTDSLKHDLSIFNIRFMSSALLFFIH